MDVLSVCLRFAVEFLLLPGAARPRGPATNSLDLVAERNSHDDVAPLPLAFVFADDANAVAGKDRVRRANRANVLHFASGGERELDDRLAALQPLANGVAGERDVAHHRG